MAETAPETAGKTKRQDEIAEMVTGLHGLVLSRDPIVHTLPTLTAQVPNGSALVWISKYVKAGDAGAEGFDLIAALAAENLRRTSGEAVPLGAAIARLKNKRMGEILIGRLTSASPKTLAYEVTTAVTAPTDDRIRVDFYSLAKQVVWAYRKPRDTTSWKRTVRTWASDYHHRSNPTR